MAAVLPEEIETFKGLSDHDNTATSPGSAALFDILLVAAVSSASIHQQKTAPTVAQTSEDASQSRDLRQRS
ncbi:hypothetical protein [Adonisia turfae]|uniref:hypothetical protein n=1 Tax=Adonisia turfae TaxID=2950184 RepID=UPI0013D32F0B|nr:hypothetical protein [Adonisia turfae]